MIKTSIILAAGRGDRMKPLTDYVPKSLIKCHGRSLINWSIDAIRKDSDKIYVTYGYKADQLLPEIYNLVDGLINTTNKGNSYFLFNSPIQSINTPVVIIPCDSIIEYHINLLYDEFMESNVACMIVPIDTNIDECDRIQFNSDTYNVTSIGRTVESNISSSGLQILNPLRINELMGEQENFIDIWQNLIKLNELKISTNKLRVFKTFDTMQQLDNSY